MSSENKQAVKDKVGVDLVAEVASMSRVIKWSPLSFESRPPFETRVLFCRGGTVYIGQLECINKRYEFSLSKGEACSVYFIVRDDEGGRVDGPDFWANLPSAPCELV